MTAHPKVRAFDRTTPPHIVTLVLIAGLPAASMNLFLPSLPAMTEYFDTSYATMQLALGAYLAANAPLQILLGPLSDRHGRRLLTLWSCGLFVLATIGCLLAPTTSIFLFFRILQAVIASGIVLSRAAVRDMVEDQSQAASMIAYVTMGMALVPMAAPVLGGFLDHQFGWHANFIALGIAGAGLFALVWYDMGETFTPRDISLGAQFSEYPELLRSRRFWGYAMTTAFSAGTFFAYLGGGPKVGTEVFGLTPQALGLYFGAPALGYLVGNFLSGRFSTRLGVAPMVMFGSISVVTAPVCVIVLATLGLDHPAAFFVPMIFVGLGNGMVMPNATAGMLSLRPHLAGSAAGLGSAIMIGGGAALSMLAGVVMTPGSGVSPLALLMLASGLCGIATMLYVRHINRLEAA